MRPSTLITSLTLGYATARGSPVASIEAARSEPGHVTDASGTPYALYETDSNDIHVITNKINGEFMKPVNYTINANHVCTFWRSLSPLSPFTFSTYLCPASPRAVSATSSGHSRAP